MTDHFGISAWYGEDSTWLSAGASIFWGQGSDRYGRAARPLGEFMISTARARSHEPLSRRLVQNVRHGIAGRLCRSPATIRGKEIHARYTSGAPGLDQGQN